jgi:hypothetical protein
MPLSSASGWRQDLWTTLYILLDCIMFDLVTNFCGHGRRKTLKSIFVHLDNVHPHNSKQSYECLEGFHVRRVPYLAYSPDLVPSDFFFGYLKTKLAGLVIRSREELISTIRQIFDEIPREIHFCRSFVETMFFDLHAPIEMHFSGMSLRVREVSGFAHPMFARSQLLNYSNFYVISIKSDPDN